MPERQLVPHSDKRSQRTSSLANRFQSIAPSQRIGLFNSERIRCAYRAATTATNYDGKTLVVNGTGNGGTSASFEKYLVLMRNRHTRSFCLLVDEVETISKGRRIIAKSILGGLHHEYR